jgi:antitoxin Phd
MRSEPAAKWQLQHAQARFSEPVDDAVEKGPQIVTRRGVDTAVVVSIDEWQNRKPATPGTGKTFCSAKVRGSDIPIAKRGTGRSHKPPVFD